MISSASWAASTHSSGTLGTVLITVEGGAAALGWTVVGGAWVTGAASGSSPSFGRIQPKAVPARNSRASAPAQIQRGRSGAAGAVAGGACTAGRGDGWSTSSVYVGSNRE